MLKSIGKYNLLYCQHNIVDVILCCHHVCIFPRRKYLVV